MNHFPFFMIFVFLFFGVIILIGLGGGIFWVWMLVEVLTRETDEKDNKLVWALIIVLTNWIGALIYFLTRRKERIKEIGK